MWPKVDGQELEKKIRRRNRSMCIQRTSKESVIEMVLMPFLHGWAFCFHALPQIGLVVGTERSQYNQTPAQMRDRKGLL